jgi:prepilin-type N-terminal cleavage/methylation domain-containing protein
MQQRGFSIVELMVALVVAGLVLTIGVPAFSTFSRSLGERRAREELRQHLRGARQAAVTRHCPVVMVFGDGVATTGITTYSVHVDTNGDHVRQSTEPVATYGVPRNCQIEACGFSPTDSLVFDLSGALWPGTAGGLFIVSGASNSDTLAVSATGMVYDP